MVSWLVKHSKFIKTFCHCKYLNHTLVYNSDNHGTFNLVVITNKEVHMVHSNINNNNNNNNNNNDSNKLYFVASIRLAVQGALQHHEKCIKTTCISRKIRYKSSYKLIKSLVK